MALGVFRTKETFYRALENTRFKRGTSRAVVMAIKNHDFVEVEYTGKLKDTGDIFDTTDEKTARDADIFSQDQEYKPVIICVGEAHILPGIDKFIEGKEPGAYTIELSAEGAFGKKDAKLIQMIPASKFKQQDIQPVPGLRLNIDGQVGIVRTVTGGRVIVDFNHPLASKDVVYELKVNRIVDDKKEQVQALMRSLLGMRDADVTVQESKARITMPKLPDEILDELKKKLKELTGLEIEFVEPEKK